MTEIVTRDPDQYCGVRIGAGIALVKGPTFVLVAPENGLFAEQLWALMNAAAGVDELLEALSAHGLRSLGDFAMVQVEDGSFRIVVRGNAVASVMTEAGPKEIHAAGVRTWVEELFPAALSFTLSLETVESPSSPFRIGSGILPADLLQWGSVESPILADMEMEWVSSFEPADIDEATEPHADLPDEDVAESDAAKVYLQDSEDETPPELPWDVNKTKLPPGLEPDSSEPVDDDREDRFDFLYGHTTARSVQGAAVEESEDVPEADAPSTSPELPMASSGDDELVQPAVESGLIEMVPSSEGAEVSTAGSLGDHDGRTISSADLRALRGGTLPVSPSGGPKVLALACSAGHMNPPHAAACRSCGAALSGAPREVARPAMGRLSFSSGDSIDLDRPVLIGRNPKVEGQLSEIPQVVKLDIGQGLSRSHAVVRLEGWQVLLEDLGSANGTEVTLPGRDPRRLHPGEPVLLEPGCSIDFGGEVTATYSELV